LVDERFVDHKNIDKSLQKSNLKSAPFDIRNHFIDNTPDIVPVNLQNQHDIWLRGATTAACSSQIRLMQVPSNVERVHLFI
jgi:hypothetical protein